MLTLNFYHFNCNSHGRWKKKSPPPGYVTLAKSPCASVLVCENVSLSEIHMETCRKVLSTGLASVGLENTVSESAYLS